MAWIKFYTFVAHYSSPMQPELTCPVISQLLKLVYYVLHSGKF